MGITADEFFENVYNVIFSPKSFFDNKEVKVSVRLAVATVVIMSVIGSLTKLVIDESIAFVLSIPMLLFTVFMAVLIWFLTALFFEYIAKIFSVENNFKKVLFFTAFSNIPFVFFAPLNLLKQIGIIGNFLSVFLGILLYLWIMFLYAYSLRAAYGISFSRSFMLIFLPFVASFVALHWLLCFFVRIESIFLM